MATSSPQVLSSVPVYDYYLPPGNPTLTNPKAVAGKVVKVTLYFGQASSASPNPVTALSTDPVITQTDNNGFWQVNLVATDQMTPANVLYSVEIDGRQSYLINPVAAGVPGIGWQSSAIIVSAPASLIPAGQTVGNLTVSGTLSVTGLITGAAGLTLSGGSLTIASGGFTMAGPLTLTAAASQIIPGATSMSLRNSGNTADNLLVTNAGNATVRGSLTVTGGGLTVSANGAAITGNSTVTGTLGVSAALTVTTGGLTVSAGGASITGGATVVTGDLTITAARLVFGASVSKIVPGSTSISHRNNADNADNLLIPDNGRAVFRNGLALLGTAVDVPAGTLGYASVTANQGTFTGATDLTGLTVTVTVGSGRRIKITGQIILASSVTDDSVLMNINEGATNLYQASMELSVTGGGGTTLIAEVILTPTAGAHTYKLQGQRQSGSGNITMIASATQPAFILCEDIGT